MSFSFYMDEGRVAMSTEPDNTILPDIVMSLSVPKGSWFLKPDFGHELRDVKSATTDAPALVADKVRAATKWLIDIGRATEIAVSSEFDPKDLQRINYLVIAKQADGVVVTWSAYHEVL